MNDKVWLVEIRLKDWEPDLSTGGRVVAFEEIVGAHDEYSARQAGFDQFAARARYEHVMRLKLSKNGITEHNCCAPDAVLL